MSQASEWKAAKYFVAVGGRPWLVTKSKARELRTSVSLDYDVLSTVCSPDTKTSCQRLALLMCSCFFVAEHLLTADNHILGVEPIRPT